MQAQIVAVADLQQTLTTKNSEMAILKLSLDSATSKRDDLSVELNQARDQSKHQDELAKQQAGTVHHTPCLFLLVIQLNFLRAKRYLLTCASCWMKRS